ncbi:DUF4131 domain-containing protein [Secundilactobacillus odoratitofui]|uniref:DUF4131 domain-containing protein n=1 Tax=Secundilactobacillus odoratitofui TaxID=480930 RepID=UPI0006D2A5AA|nr:DUF4131 domain-containing protein [Secundilactobacillus odoratitofui]
MKTQRKFDIITVVLSLVTGLLLYIKIVDYYQLSNLWVNHSDARLHHFILMLWLLVAGLILSILLWFYFRSKDAGTKPWIGFGILLVTLFGSFYQYTHAPNYQSYHETPYPISATAVEKRVNSKSYDLYNDGPIYFYRKNDHSYPKVRKLIRQYSLAQQNDLDCIDMATLKKSLGQKKVCRSD